MIPATPGNPTATTPPELPASPASGEPAEKRESDALPGVTGEDRIGSAALAATGETGIPDGAVQRLEAATEPPAGPHRPMTPDTARIEPSFGSGSMSTPPAAPLAPPVMIPQQPPSPLNRPDHPPIVPVEPDADAPTLMMPSSRQTTRAPDPTPAAPTNVVPPPPPRLPPPLPVDALPPPRIEAPRRPMLSPEQHPMPSTIAPTEPVRKRSNARSKAARSSVVVVFDGLMSLAAIVAIVLFVAAFAGRQEFELPGPLTQAKVVVIPPKKTREEIGDILEKAGVVSSSTVFLYGSIFAQVTDLKAGEYEFHPQQSMRDVAEQIHDNKVVQHKITFPEGWTSEQIVQRLLDDPILAGKIVAIPEEGSLLPDTYTYPMGETRQQILDRMHKAQERRLTDIWAHRNADALRQLKVPKDLVILASIIEKETSKAEERPRVAAVFVNRLNRNMPLQTDPTILYGLYGGKAWTEPRTLTKADLAAPNPYNTYKINGLPPGAIANPGKAALEAAANPAATNDLFFVADGTGGHAFAETIEEHNKNVARWREIERQRHAADPTAATIGGGTGVLTAPVPVQAATPPTTTTRAPANPQRGPAATPQRQQQRPRPVVPADAGTIDTN